MVYLEYASEGWIRIVAEAPFAGTRDALVRENLITHVNLVSGTEKQLTVNVRAEMILNHIVKMLMRCEKLAKECKFFSAPDYNCRDCANKEDCYAKIAGRK